jgi:hypothetical protein
MEVSQTSTLYFGDFQVVQLSNFTQVGLSYPALGSQQATDELDRVVP